MHSYEMHMSFLLRCPLRLYLEVIFTIFLYVLHFLTDHTCMIFPNASSAVVMSWEGNPPKRFTRWLQIRNTRVSIWNNYEKLFLYMFITCSRAHIQACYKTYMFWRWREIMNIFYFIWPISVTHTSIQICLNSWFV